MFNFLRSTSPHQPSPALQQALAQQGLPPGKSVDSLRVLTASGSYAGRSVRYFRVFDGAVHGGVSVRTFRDLDTHPELVVGSGHVDRDGTLALTGRATTTTGPTPVREAADRAAHLDDERLVFWSSEGSRLSAATLSEAATTWHHAKSNQTPERVTELPRLGRA